MPARLLLLPGLGADERLFSRLGKLCVPVVAVRLPVPGRHESFTAYALRVAAQLDLRPEDWIGGSSFGSFVAADIARRRPVAGLVLIGGGLDSSALTAPIRLPGPLSGLLPWRLLFPSLVRSWTLEIAFGRLPAETLGVLSAMASETPAIMMRRGVRLLTGYFPRIPVLCPVHAIHGDHDRFLRPPPLDDCRIVSGAGHALALSHPREVTDFLGETICRDVAPGS